MNMNKLKIGLTYDLRSDYLKEGYSMEETAEFDKEETIEGIEQALHELGYITERIGNARHLMKALINGDSWDLVFNICEGMYGDSRESLVPALLDAYRIPHVFSGAVTLGISLNKALTKRLVRDAGIRTPDFFVINQPADVEHCTLAYPLFAKPVAEGTGKGVEDRSVIRSKEELQKVSASLLHRFNQPVLVEEYLPGREFTVGVVGNGADAEVIGAMEVIYKQPVTEVYSYFNKENYENLITYQKVEGEWLKQCERMALKVWDVLEVHDGGRIDVRVDKEGQLSFIEINPLAGLNPKHSDLPILSRLNGIGYTELMEKIMNAAIKRIAKKSKK